MIKKIRLRSEISIILSNQNYFMFSPWKIMMHVILIIMIVERTVWITYKIKPLSHKFIGFILSYIEEGPNVIFPWAPSHASRSLKRGLCDGTCPSPSNGDPEQWAPGSVATEKYNYSFYIYSLYNKITLR